MRFSVSQSMMLTSYVEFIIFRVMSLIAVTLPVAFGLFIALIVVLPVVRQRIRTGVWAVVVRDSSTSVESFVRWATTGFFIAIGAWTVLVPAAGTSSVGAWTVPGPALWTGLGVIAAGFAIIVVAQAQMGASWRIGIDDEPTPLVTTGLFRWVRHPIYTGVLAIVIGVTCMTPAPWTIAGLVVGYILIAIQSRLEEEHMCRQHPAAFARWASRTGRFVPGIGRRDKAGPGDA